MNPVPIQIVAVGVGGIIGGIARFWITHLVDSRHGDSFPWGTLLVNVTGALIIGLIAAPFSAAGVNDEPLALLWLILVVGILGSYTTVSAFSLQTLNLLRARRKAGAWLYVFASLLLSLVAVTSGYLTGQWLFTG